MIYMEILTLEMRLLQQYNSSSERTLICIFEQIRTVGHNKWIDVHCDRLATNKRHRIMQVPFAPYDSREYWLKCSASDTLFALQKHAIRHRHQLIAL